MLTTSYLSHRRLAAAGLTGLFLLVSPLPGKTQEENMPSKSALPAPTGAMPKKEIKEPKLSKELKLSPDKDRNNRWIGGKLTSLWRGDPIRKEIALTFDDGPHPTFTPRLLDLLQHLHVRATFFLVGKKVDATPQIVVRIAQEGHEVANHTYDHINLGKVSPDIVEEQIRKGNEAIYRACGKQPTFFRPPGGHHEEKVYLAAEKLNMTTVLWTDDPADFAKPGADVIEDRILKDLGNGSDILLHDGVEQTLQMLPDLIARLRRDGYRFVTIKEMAQRLETTHLVHK